MKTFYLSLGSALLLAACFTPSGSGEPSGTAEPPGPTSEGPATTGAMTGAEGTTSSGTLATTDVLPTGGSVTTDPPGTATGATTGEPCTDDDCECTNSTDCETPLLCHEGQCVGCIDDTGCGGGVCDPVEHVCRGCREHSECPKTACELDDGLCFPVIATTHAHVDPELTCVDGPCSADQPCCSIDQALTTHLDSSHMVIHLAPGVVKAGAQVTEGGRKIAILGDAETVFNVDAPNGAIIGLGADGQEAIDSELYVARVTVAGGNGGSALRCSRAATLWLDDVQILNFNGRPLSASACEVTVRRSALRSHAGVAVDTTSSLALENVILAHHGVGAALELGSNTEARLLYTTVGDRSNHTFGLLTCVDASSLLDARNSVLVSDHVGDTVNCVPTSSDITDSVVSTDQLIGQDNGVHVLAPVDVAKQFIDWFGGDLHVHGDSALLGRALWRSGDPRTDIEGDPRPTVDLTPDVAGADRPPG